MKSWARFIFVAFWSLATLGCSIDVDITDLTLESSTLNFEDPENFEFDSNYVEIKDNKVALKPLDLVDSGEDFARGNHVGSHTISEQITIIKNTSAINSHVNTILPSLSSNLVGYWRMENNWLDESPTGANGIPINFPVFNSDTVFGETSGAFNGSNQRIDIGDIELLKSEKITISAWVLTLPGKNVDRDQAA